MNRTLWIILALMLAAHLAIDLVFPWAMSFGPETIVIFALLGAVAAQLNLIALWAVFAPGGVGWRLPWAALMAGGMWIALTVSNRLNWPHTFRAGDCVQLAIVLIGGCLLAQIPLWGLRLFWKYRLYVPQANDEPAEHQYHLRHLLLGMGLLSVVLGVGRWIMPSGQWWAGDWSFSLAVLFPTAVVVNLLVTLPVIGISAMSARIPGIVCATLMLPYTVILSLLEYVFLITVLGPVGGWHTVVLFNVGQMLTVAITLAILRWLGFRWLTQQQWQDEQQLRLANEGLSPEVAARLEATAEQE